MSSRARKPSSKAVEIARSHQPTPAPAKKAAASKGKARKGNQAKASSAKTSNAQRADAADGDDGPAANRLYCICLGTDDGTPMIQCEGCENWFHFRCMDMDPHAAGRIQAYYCEICTEVGAGVTQYLPEGYEPTGQDEDSGPDYKEARSDGGASDANNTRMDEDSGSDAVQTFEQRKKRKAPKPTTVRVNSMKRKKQKKAEGLSSSEDEDDDYNGEGDAELIEDKRERLGLSKHGSRKPAPRRKESSSGSGHQSDRTRQSCIETLAKTLEPIFFPGQANTSAPSQRSLDFSSEVEAELFEQHADGDGRNRAPKAKYLGKFRSLIYNIKTNETLRLQIGSGSLEPTQVVNLSPEDLLTPELRAMAENVRARSLKDSVKQVEAGPRIRKTHKGEEVIDDATTTENVSRDKTARESMRASTSSMQMDAQSPQALNESFNGMRSPSMSMPPPDDVNRSPHHQRSNSSSQRPRMPSVSQSSVFIPEPDLGAEENALLDQLIVSEPASMQTTSALGGKDGTPSQTESGGQSPATKAKFDFSSIWGSFQSPTTPKIEQEGAEDGKANAGDGDDEYDPFANVPGSSALDDVDMELEELLSGATKAPVTTTPPGSPPPLDAVPKSEFIRSFAPVWRGDVLMPDEGGFPSVAVQVAGRALGSSEELWKSILPTSMFMAGRIESKTALDYLVQCAFANSRELVVIALLPDLEGPTASQPDRPTAESGTAKQNHLIQFLSNRKRFGVCPPSDQLKRVVKDIYVVPLLAKEPLPEYIELLDQHALGESGERDTDLLLAVMVMVKGAVQPGAVLPPSNPTPPVQTPQSMQAPPMTQMTPQHFPSAPAGFPGLPPAHAAPPSTAPDLSLIDPVALQGLLSQPQALQNLFAANNQAAAGLMNNPNLVPALHSNSNIMQNLASDPNLLQTLLAAVPPNPPTGPSGFSSFQPPQQGYGQSYGNPDWDRRGPPRNRSRSRSPPRRNSRGFRDERDDYGRDDYGRDRDYNRRGSDRRGSRDFDSRSRDTGWSNRGRR